MQSGGTIVYDSEASLSMPRESKGTMHTLGTRWRQLSHVITVGKNFCLVKMAPLFVALAFSGIMVVIYLMFTSVIPYYTEGSYDTPLHCFHLIFGAIMSINIVYNFCMAVAVDPGRPPKSSNNSVPDSEGGASYIDGVRSFSTYCRVCRNDKPERTHHCNTCNRCVMKMDHHCPWIGQCVGLYNLRYFTLFLMEMLVGTCYCSLMTLPVIVRLFTSDDANLEEGVSLTEFAIVFSLTSGSFIAMAMMAPWHVHLICSGQTTIEYHVTKGLLAFGREPIYKYDVGTAKNWESVFGYGMLNPILYIVPTYYTPESSVPDDHIV